MLELFCHVGSGICSQQWGHARHGSDQDGESGRFPSRVREGRPHLFRRCSGRENPERYKDAKEAANVKDQDTSFDQMKLLGQESIEADADQEKEDLNQSCVPRLWDV